MTARTFCCDFTEPTPPMAPPPQPAQPAPEPLAPLGPDEAGRYHYLGEPAGRHEAATRAGHLIRSQAGLQAIAPILREDRAWAFEKPQPYIVTTGAQFVLGGHINEHVDAAGGAPVLVAGEATLEEQPGGTWTITALNSRSYGSMPAASSWAAVERALRDTGIARPTGGFREIYLREGSWAEILAVLRS